MNGWEVTGSEGMRPLQIGEILSRIWDLLRGNIMQYFKLAALPGGTALLIYAALFRAMHRAGMFPAPPRGTPPDPGKIWIFPVTFLVILPVMMVVYAIYEGAACSTVLSAMRGERMTFSEAYRVAGRRTGSLICMMFLRMLVAILPWLILIFAIAVAAALGILRSGTHPGALFVLIPLVVLAYIGGIAWVIWIALHWSLGAPACMAESLTGCQALQRSGQLSRGGKWRILGVLFLVGLLGTACIFALEMLGFALFGVGALAGIALHVHLAGVSRLFWGPPLAVFLAVVFYGILALQWASYCISLTVLYQDQRFRHEGSLALPLSS